MQTECSFWTRARLLSLATGCLAALALTMPLEVALYHLGAAGGAIHLGLRRGRAALVLVGLHADPQLEVLSAPKALEQRAAAALEALFAPPLQRRLRTRWERQLGLRLGAALLNGHARRSSDRRSRGQNSPHSGGTRACSRASSARSPGKRSSRLSQPGRLQKAFGCTTRQRPSRTRPQGQPAVKPTFTKAAPRTSKT